MGLTPVRIRGKRKRKSPSTISSLQFQNKDNLPKKMRRSLATVRASRASRHRPVLESLPTELLEDILLYSGNIALPRSGHIIGVKLSGRATLLRLFMMAFHETWLQWFGIPRAGCHGPHQKGKALDFCEGDASFQSAMLDLPWVKIDFILQAQQAWADRYARDRWYEHSVPHAKGQDELSHAHKGGFSHFNASNCFAADYERALKWPAWETESMNWGTQEVHPLIRLPMELLTGPWDEEKKRRLFWLVRAGIQLDGENQRAISWEVKVQCLDNAVISAEQPDPLIVNCLIGGWIFKDLPEDVVRTQLARLERRLEWGYTDAVSEGILRRVRSALYIFTELPQYGAMPI